LFLPADPIFGQSVMLSASASGHQTIRESVIN
jgi:hypothetical protein